MTKGQNTQSVFDVESKIADVLILLIDGYKKSGGEIADAIGVNQATISRLKNKTQKSTPIMLNAVLKVKQDIESEMQDLVESKAKEAGRTVQEFTLCCVNWHEIHRIQTNNRAFTNLRAVVLLGGFHASSIASVSL
jgi:DNA-binding Xre family transcriptional regulator